jgi:hypothetical protein
MNTNWICPHCGTHATLGSADTKSATQDVLVETATKDEGITVSWNAKKCPNLECGKFTLEVGAWFYAVETWPNGTKRVGNKRLGPVGAGYFRMLPRVGKPLSAYSPRAVREDYEEACSIKDLSSKAAATLCRRALQGMVRDFWGVAERTLHAELKKIEPRCDVDLFGALMGIKSIGNIGAHPELDINVIVDVEEGEVDALIEVLQILDQEWYAARAARAARLSSVHALGAAKAASAAASPVPPPAP